MTTKVDRAIAKEALTPKQREVLDLLGAGQRPPAIAKKLKLTRSSVYNHMRNMRKLGIELPNERVGTSSEPEPVGVNLGNTNGASANGYTDPIDALDAAILLGRKRLEEIAEDLDAIRERGERLHAERDEVTGQLQRFERATEALRA